MSDRIEELRLLAGLMGWTEIPPPYETKREPKDGEFWTQGSVLFVGPNAVAWNPFESIADAMMLLRKCATNGYVISGSGVSVHVTIHTTKFLPADNAASAFAEDECEAICKAALKTVDL